MKIGLALGGGGAKGLAHIPLLEVFDELGVRPAVISGTSIGAIVGAMYAAGRSGKQIRAFVEEVVPQEEESTLDSLKKLFANGMTDIVSLNFGGGGIFDHSKIDKFFGRLVDDSTFETLETPLKIVAADFWKREEIVFETGDLGVAVRASMAIPGIFKPVEWEGRILVDGGGVNPLPFDLLRQECDLVVAVDVSGMLTPPDDPMPGALEALMGMSQVMSRSIVESRLKLAQPDLLLRPTIEDVRVLEFWKASAIYHGAEAEAQRLREWLTEVLA